MTTQLLSFSSSFFFSFRSSMPIDARSNSSLLLDPSALPATVEKIHCRGVSGRHRIDRSTDLLEGRSKENRVRISRRGWGRRVDPKRGSVAAATNPSVSKPFNATAGKKGRSFISNPSSSNGSNETVDHARHRAASDGKKAKERRRGGKRETETEREGERERERKGEREREVDTDSHTFHAGRPAVTSPFIQ